MGAGETRPIAAAVLMLAGMVIIGFIDNFVSRLAEHIGLWQFLLTRLILSLPLLVLLSRLGAGQLRPKNFAKVMVRSFLIAAAMSLYFGALAFVSIGEALAGLFTSPIFILLITVFFLKYRIGPWRVLAVTVGFVGVLLVLQLNTGEFSVVSLMPVCGGLLYAIGNLVTRYWCAEESTMSLLLGIFSMQGLLGLIAMCVLGVWQIEAAPGTDGFLARGLIWPPDPAIWPIMALQVVGSLAGVFCLIRAYQWGDASYVSVFEYSIMVFGPVFAFFLFGHVIGLWQVVGIFLIICAGAIIAVRSQ